MIAAMMFALLTAIFAVINVEKVKVNYLFGTSEIPLILVILSSALLGGLMVGLFGIIRQIKMQKMNARLEHQLDAYRRSPSAQIAETDPDTSLE